MYYFTQTHEMIDHGTRQIKFFSIEIRLRCEQYIFKY